MLIRTRIAWLLVTLAAAVLCMTPLFSLLGYESSAAMGVVLGATAAWISAWEFSGGRVPGPWDPSRSRSPGRDWAARLVPRLAMALPPLGLLLLNMLRVRNCDPLTGLGFWLVIPMASVVIGHTLGVVGAALRPRPRAATAIALGLCGLDLAVFLARLVLEPPIQGHLWLAGWFAGSIYDEAITIPATLLWHRAALLATVGLAVLVVEARWQRLARPAQAAPWIRAAAVAAVPTAALWWAQDAAGVHLDADDIRERLGGELTTEHFTVWYDPASLEADELRLLEDDLEFRYDELADFFDEDPVAWKGRPVGVYLYPSRQVQHRLFGSRGTFVARPWTHEMHLRWDGPGDTALAHELAHLFTAPFGGGPLRLATQDGVLVHLGLVEGIAMAADWPPSDQDPHTTAAALRALGKAPDARRLFDPDGFWTQPGGKAYTVMGSFVRWLVDTHGIAAFKEVYRRGHWEEVYGRSTDQLIGEWEAWVDQIEVPTDDTERVRHKHRRGSIFDRPCARTLAELGRQASNAESRGDAARALALRQEIRGHKRGDAQDGEGLEIARLYGELDRHDEALALVDGLLAREGRRGPTPAMEARIRELRGDLLWRREAREEAAAEYGRCLAGAPGGNAARRLLVKQTAALHDDPAIAAGARSYFLAPHKRAGMLYLAMQWAERDPTDPLPRYLVGLQLRGAGECGAAIDWLQGPPGLIAAPALDERRRQLLGQCALETDALDLAERTWRTLLRADSGQVAMQAEEALRRVAWKRARQP